MKKIILSLIAFIFLQQSYAQLISESFGSQKLNDKRQIAIYLPDNYHKDQSYPLFVVLDADYMMEPVIANARCFAYFENMPNSIIVGVYNQNNDVFVSEDIGFPMNEAALFYEFLSSELIPYISGKYSVNGFTGIIASGESANFANYYLLKEKSIFNAFLSINPELVHQVVESLPSQFQTLNQQVFYYMATTNLNDENHYKKVSELDSSVKNKGTNESIDYYYEDFIGSSPNAVTLTAIPRAFDLLFDAYKPITVKEHREKIVPLSENIFGYLKDKYDNIYNTLKIRKKPSLNDIMAVYSVILRKEDWTSLLQLSEFVKDNGYKDTAMPNFLLAEYYEEIGEPKKALRAYQSAYTEKGIDFINPDLINERITALKTDFGW